MIAGRMTVALQAAAPRLSEAGPTEGEPNA